MTNPAPRYRVVCAEIRFLVQASAESGVILSQTPSDALVVYEKDFAHTLAHYADDLQSRLERRLARERGRREEAE